MNTTKRIHSIKGFFSNDEHHEKNPLNEHNKNHPFTERNILHVQDSLKVTRDTSI